MRLTHALPGACAVVLAFGAAFQLGRPSEPQAAARVKAEPIAASRALPAIPSLGLHGAPPALAQRPERDRPRKRDRASGTRATAPAPADDGAAPSPGATTPPRSPAADPAPSGGQPRTPAPPVEAGGEETGAFDPAPTPAPRAPVPQTPDETDPGTEDGEVSEE